MRGHFDYDFFGRHFGDHFGYCSRRFGFPGYSCFGYWGPYGHHDRYHGQPYHMGTHGPPHEPHDYNTDCGPTRGHHGAPGYGMSYEPYPPPHDGPGHGPHDHRPRWRPERDHCFDFHGHGPRGSNRGPGHEHGPHRSSRPRQRPDRHGPHGRHDRRFELSPDHGFGYGATDWPRPSRCYGPYSWRPHGPETFGPCPPCFGPPYNRGHAPSRRRDSESGNEGCCTRNEERVNDERTENRPNAARDKDENVTGDTILVQRIVVEKGGRPKSV